MRTTNDRLLREPVVYKSAIRWSAIIEDVELTLFLDRNGLVNYTNWEFLDPNIEDDRSDDKMRKLHDQILGLTPDKALSLAKTFIALENWDE